MTALFDTGVLLDFLAGTPEAADLLANFPHGSVSVITWVELMRMAPSPTEETTRNFLRQFERLALNEAIADRAVLLARAYPELPLTRALIWATAQVNSLEFVSVDLPQSLRDHANVRVPYQAIEAIDASRSE